MQPTLPIKKTTEEIKLYKSIGYEYEKILRQLSRWIQEGIICNYEKEFELACKKEFKAPLFPFKKQLNHKGKPFGHSICLSINDQIAHTKPGPIEFHTGDIVSIDCGMKLCDLNFDAAFTYQFGKKATGNEWYLMPNVAINHIIHSNPQGTQELAEIVNNSRKEYNKLGKEYLSTIVKLTGHGIGHSLHEGPIIHNMPGNFLDFEFFNGLVFCAEPIFAKSKKRKDICSTYMDSDEWSILTTSGEPASHFESMFLFDNGHLIDLIGISNWIF